MQMTTYICDNTECDTIMEEKPKRQIKVKGALLLFDKDYCDACKAVIMDGLSREIFPCENTMIDTLFENDASYITDFIASKMAEEIEEKKEKTEKEVGWPEYNGPFYKLSDID